jgi:thiol-disulfide isomerase/thioredoxin
MVWDMTANRFVENFPGKKSGLVTIATIVLFAIASFFLTRPATPIQSLSPLSGLITLKTTVQESIPYPVAIANNKPTLVEFYADWCTTCQAIAPTLQSIHHQLDDRVNFVMLNIDDPKWYEQIQEYQVNGVPHLVLLNGDRAIVDRFIGKVPRSILYNRITDLLELPT